MTDAQRRYVRTEMVIAAAINAVLSIAFLLVVFGGRSVVPVWGWGGLVVDSLPQSLMIALMGTLVPTLLTRRRLANGTIGARPTAHRWPGNAFVRSAAIAVPVAGIAGAIHALLLPLTGSSWPFVAVAVFKPIYGALLGAAIARLAVTAALSDPDVRIRERRRGRNADHPDPGAPPSHQSAQ